MAIIVCETCGKLVRRTPWQVSNSKHHYCSRQCHYNCRDWSDVESQYGGIVRKGRDIGYKSDGQVYIRHACAGCGKERWVQMKRNKPSSLRCHKCCYLEEHRERLYHATFKGGRHKNSNGYINIAIADGSPFVSMRNATTYVMEHRLVVAQSLGRCLRNDEIVHHLNGVRDDNRLSNLLLTSPNEHSKIIPVLQKRIQELEVALEQTHGIEVVLSR